jgi:hypothetical protein
MPHFATHNPCVFSRYHGYKWHDFEEKLPLPLLHHINGNAIYNVSHPLMQLMLEQLSLEASGLWNMIPFDLRMGQMWLEGTLQVAEDMLPSSWNGTALAEGSTWGDNTAKFEGWWKQHGMHYHSGGGKMMTIPAMQESSLIKNYAATNMLKEYFEGTETITHGANMYNRWDHSAHGKMTLVVSDWGSGEGELAKLLRSAAASDHPFSELLVMTTNNPVGDSGNATALNVTWAELATKGVNVQLVDRQESRDFLDWCTAPVDTPWFMYTNSYHRLRRTIDVMATDSGKPLVPYIYADTPFCSEFPSCAAAMERARVFDPDADKHVQVSNCSLLPR